MSDLVSREWLEDAFDNLCCHNCKMCRNFRIEDSFYKCALIDKAPTIDFEKLGKSLNCQIRASYGSCDDCELSCPRNELIKLLGLKRPKGEWLRTDAYPHKIYCSVCYKTFADSQWKIWKDGGLPRAFCPNCGAEMKIDKETENDG